MFHVLLVGTFRLDMVGGEFLTTSFQLVIKSTEMLKGDIWMSAGQIEASERAGIIFKYASGLIPNAVVKGRNENSYPLFGRIEGPRYFAVIELVRRSPRVIAMGSSCASVQSHTHYTANDCREPKKLVIHVLSE